MIKPKPIVTLQQKVFFLFICAIVLVIAIIVILQLFTNSSSLLQNNNSLYYSEAYRPKVEQAQENRRLEALQKKREEELGTSDSGSDSDSGDNSDASDGDSTPSSQPKPLGFSEKDIYKAKGRRYQTW